MFVKDSANHSVLPSVYQHHEWTFVSGGRGDGGGVGDCRLRLCFNICKAQTYAGQFPDTNSGYFHEEVEASPVVSVPTQTANPNQLVFRF